MNLKRFFYIDTPYALLEWPFNQYPLFGDEVVNRMFDQGITPIFAHVERYDYFWHHPEDLAEYIEEGVITQMNASTIIRHHTRKQALDFIRDGYIHVIASDAHNMEERAPRLREAYEIIEKELGYRYVSELLNNADQVFHGKEIKVRKPGKKKGLFF